MFKQRLSLCATCKNRCDGQLKSELVSRGILYYLYLNNGKKLAYNCNMFDNNDITGLDTYTTEKVNYDFSN